MCLSKRTSAALARLRTFSRTSADAALARMSASRTSLWLLSAAAKFPKLPATLECTPDFATAAARALASRWNFRERSCVRARAVRSTDAVAAQRVRRRESM